MFLQVSVCPQEVSAPLHAGIDPHGPEADTPWQTSPTHIPGRHKPHHHPQQTPPTPTPGRPPSPGRHPLGRHLPPSAWWDTHPPGRTPRADTPLPLRLPLQRTVRTYWNAFLFTLRLVVVGSRRSRRCSGTCSGTEIARTRMWLWRTVI